MRTPHDDQLIVPTMAPSPTRQQALDGIRLGHVERVCESCGKPWGVELKNGETIAASRCAHCGSNVFTERPIKPVAVVWENGKLVAVEEPKPQKAAVSARLVEELRSLRAYLQGIEPKMLASDVQLHEVMQKGNEATQKMFAPLQAQIHYMSQSDGDAPLGGQVPHFHVSLVLAVRGLIHLIDRTLQELESQE